MGGCVRPDVHMGAKNIESSWSVYVKRCANGWGRELYRERESEPKSLCVPGQMFQLDKELLESAAFCPEAVFVRQVFGSRSFLLYASPRGI
jgi:hypothetical protein